VSISSQSLKQMWCAGVGGRFGYDSDCGRVQNRWGRGQSCSFRSLLTQSNCESNKRCGKIQELDNDMFIILYLPLFDSGFPLTRLRQQNQHSYLQHEG
jgi:hypothetical protein